MPLPDNKVEADIARKTMDDFAQRTGIDENTGDTSQRYLWTDAFAVQSFFGLSHIYASDKNFNRALNLIEMVHEHLGKHRPKDERTGWISGLPEKEGEKHPTIAGLRIGKKLPERDRSEPFNDRLEWERDGQYFHYITRWITALLQAEQETEDKQMYSPDQPPEYRLAFRECGLSLGLRVLTEPKDKSSELNLDVTKRSNPLAEDIEIFWVDPVNQNASTWTNHLDINEVSLASSLIAKVYPNSFY